MNLWTALYLEFAGRSRDGTTNCAKANKASQSLLSNKQLDQGSAHPSDAIVAVDVAIDQSLVANGSDRSLLAQYLLYRF
jgi:hypothetical protein